MPLPDWTPGSEGKGLLVRGTGQASGDLRVLVWSLSDAEYHELGRQRLGVQSDLVLAHIVLDADGSFRVYEDGTVHGESYEDIVERLDGRLRHDTSSLWTFSE